MKAGHWIWIAIAVAIIGGAAAGAMLIEPRGRRLSDPFLGHILDLADPLTRAVVGGLAGLSLLAPPMAVVVFLRGRSLFRQAGARSREELRKAVCQPARSPTSPPPVSGASIPNPGPAQPGAPSA